MALTDLTGTTWVLNDTITFSHSLGLSNITSFNFTSNNTSFYGFYFDVNGDGDNSLGYRTNQAYAFNEIYDSSGNIYSGEEAYKTIAITGGTDATNSALISWLEANAIQQSATSRKSVDLTTLPGWSSLSSGSHNITVVAKANGYRDSAPSAAVQVEKAAALPNKGDIITMDAKQYRVLKTEGTVAEVLCMYDANSSIAFDSASSGYNNTYAGKSLDTYCNNTFYSGLSAAMKNAIVDKTFTQDSWNYTTSAPAESHYTGKCDSGTYYVTLDNATFGTSITRHCYVLSVQEVLDYLNATTSMGISDTTLTDTNLWKMFWNQSTSPGPTYPWLRSAVAGIFDSAFNIYSDDGSLSAMYVSGDGPVRPAFQIDLSKVEWSK